MTDRNGEAMEIQDLREAGEDGGSLMGWYAKGHHDKREFADAVQHYSGINSYSDYRRATELKTVHDYWRCVPMRGQEGCIMFKSANAGEKGAFPVTVFEFANHWAGHSFEEEKRLIEEGRGRGQREAANFAYRWIHATKGEKAAEEFLNTWNGERKIAA
jgi:hypothetical protein